MLGEFLFWVSAEVPQKPSAGSFSFRVLINSQHVLRNWHRPNCILCDLFCYKKEIVFYTFGDWFGLVSGFALYRVIRLRARKHRCKFLHGWLGRSTPWGSSRRGHQWSLVLGRQAESCQWLLWGTAFVSVRFPLWCDPYRISQGPHFTSFSLEKLLQNFPVPPVVAEQEPGSSVLHRSHGLYVNTLARCHLLSWCSPLCRMSLRLLQHPAQHLNCSPDCSHWEDLDVLLLDEWRALPCYPLVTATPDINLLGNPSHLYPESFINSVICSLSSEWFCFTVAGLGAGVLV